MQAWELVSLIEAAGKDFVGALMDSGNAVWTVEDPMRSLEIIGPYAITTSMRDSAVWQDESGAALVQWVDVGDGQIDWPAYVKRFSELCPTTPFIIETISGGEPRRFNVLEESFWKTYPKGRSSDLAAFLAYARKGKPFAGAKPPQGKTPEETAQLQQKADLLKSVQFSKQTLGIGQKGALTEADFKNIDQI